ncbi:MAG: hypothetical protein ABH842_05580 [Candidatus Micrarchaeota archaeon]
MLNKKILALFVALAVVFVLVVIPSNALSVVWDYIVYNGTADAIDFQLNVSLENSEFVNIDDVKIFTNASGSWEEVPASLDWDYVQMGLTPSDGYGYGAYGYGYGDFVGPFLTSYLGYGGYGYAYGYDNGYRAVGGPGLILINGQFNATGIPPGKYYLKAVVIVNTPTGQHAFYSDVYDVTIPTLRFLHFTDNGVINRDYIKAMIDADDEYKNFTYYLYNDSGFVNKSYLASETVGVATGIAYTCFLKTNGSVQCQGYNPSGEANNYTGNDVVQVSAGYHHTCFLKANGSVQCQGQNGFGQSNNYSGNDAIQVTTQEYHTCFLKANGSVQCQGDNWDGRANNYTGNDVVQVSAGWYHTCFLKANGSVQCQGQNPDGGANNYFGNDVIQVSAGHQYTCFLKANRSVQCQGYNDYGRANNYSGTDAIQISTNQDHMCILKANGSVQCQGQNDSGSTDPYIGNDVIQVSAGEQHTCFLKANGSVQCQGDNDYGLANNYSGTDVQKAPFHVFNHLPEGRYYLNATACDLSGDCDSTETRTIIIDAIPPQEPVITFNHPYYGWTTNNNGSYNIDVIVNGTLSESIESIEFYLDSSTYGLQYLGDESLCSPVGLIYYCSFSPAAPGGGWAEDGYELWVEVEYGGYYDTDDSVYFIIDVTAPEIELYNPINEYNTSNTTPNSASILFNFSADDNMFDESECVIYVDGIVLSPPDEIITTDDPTMHWQGFGLPTSEGKHEWYLNCTDKADNWNISETRNFTIDSIPPHITMNAPTDGYEKNFTDVVQLNVTVTDNLADQLNCSWMINGVEVSLGLVANDSILNLTRSNEPYEGKYYWNMTCIDEIGNQNTSETWYYLINDSTAPTVNLISPATGYSTTDRTPTMEFNFTDPYSPTAVCTLYVGGTAKGSKTVDNATNDEITSTTLSVGSYTWYISCTDLGDNVGNSSTRSITINSVPGQGGGGGGSGSVDTDRNTTIPHINNTPSVSCNKDSQCLGSQACLGESCQELTGICGYAANHKWNYYDCCDDAACGEGYGCFSNSCYPIPQQECSVDGDCSEGQKCVNGYCKQQTTTNTSTIPKECTKDSECEAGKLCVNYQCTSIEVQPDQCCPFGICGPKIFGVCWYYINVLILIVILLGITVLWGGMSIHNHHKPHHRRYKYKRRHKHE